MSLVVLCVYGFPESHPNRCMNEEMLIDVFASMATLNMPSVMGGDLNSVHGESLAMVLAEALGIYCVSPTNKPTTRTKEGETSTTKPLDYVFANYQAKDLIQAARVNYAVTLSDHYPIEVRLSVVKPMFMRVRWPRRTVLPQERKGTFEFPWLPEDIGFAKWQRLATRWLAATFGQRVAPKNKVRIVNNPPMPKCDDKPYRQLIKLNLAVQHIQRHGATKERLRSIQRKVAALPQHLRHTLGPSLPCDLSLTIEEVIKQYATEKNQQALKAWRQKMAAWKSNSKQACAFVRNPPPQKLTMLKDVNGATANPMRIQELLMAYWGRIESWPAPGALTCAMDNLENYYSFPSSMCALPCGPNHRANR